MPLRHWKRAVQVTAMALGARWRSAQIQRLGGKCAEGFVVGFEQELERRQALQAPLHVGALGDTAAQIAELFLQRSERRMRRIVSARGECDREAAQVARQVDTARPKRLATGEQLAELTKDPRIAQRWAPEHDGVTASLFEHSQRRLRVPNVSIAHDRNAELTANEPHDAPVCRAA